MTHNQLQNIEQLEAQLWDAADNLRANSKLTAGEYCMPVLGVIFLRHATNRYNEALRAIEAEPSAHPLACRVSLESPSAQCHLLDPSCARISQAESKSDAPGVRACGGPDQKSISFRNTSAYDRVGKSFPAAKALIRRGSRCGSDHLPGPAENGGPHLTPTRRSQRKNCQADLRPLRRAETSDKFLPTSSRLNCPFAQSAATPAG